MAPVRREPVVTRAPATTARVLQDMQGQTVTGVSEHQSFDARVMSPYFNDILVMMKKPRVSLVKFEHEIATS